MLTRADRTVSDGLAVLDEVRPLGLTHIGFKDVGVPAPELGELAGRIRAMGATSYLEIVSTTRDECLAAARLARAIGVDRLLGGTHVADVLAILAGSAVEYLPFPGRPWGHPTRLDGSAAEIERDSRAYREQGCAGVDLLAYRATGADPLELVRAARRGCDGIVLVAGGIASPAQIRAIRDAGADAFTVGSAVLEGTFAPGAGPLAAQLQAVLDACR